MPDTTFAPSEDPVAAIGRTETGHDLIAADRVAALAATLDVDPPARELPPGWHWLYFNPFVRRGALGRDGHPRRGGFLPDAGLPRRMWAGGRLTYHAPLPIGVQATRESTIRDVATKDGRSGRLVFVTVAHRVHHEGTLCIEEEQDIVYREAQPPAAPGTAAPQGKPAPDDATWSEEVAPDPVLLFRYSALTANGHRIHYDRPYAMGEEGYPGLVVHGPLTATLLQGLAARCRPHERLATFSFRGMAPLFCDAPFHLEARDNDSELALWARGPGGLLAMQAEATFRA
ncbi:MaoC family dehydratase N-terminal domain-containing protein [Acuticoccus sp. I52.16.1]|uniref:FAS1-like dehydratase domain-containing protein n=1 Tax=Acuticoccus sp. I52.16.1 TaxID=2928472 RepID=UPI001FD1D3C0|nr:MaoC family dehydratase N-terminal domain-containing protein [Acuticoccus sp. I52.16.1]UOM32673.1 MaoC family dehydratase N-terminal domain-containing protein [Acuticoccus sp. I52.16.1]